MAKTSPTSRSLQYLRDQGYIANVVERWNAYAKIRQDLFGFIDLIAIKPNSPVLAIQATSGTNVSARITKAKESPNLRTWLETGSSFEVWGWSKKGKKGDRKLWTLRRVIITLEDL